MPDVKAFIAYIPVIHQGYMRFFATHPHVKTLHLINPSLAEQFGPAHKDIHGLAMETTIGFLKSLDRFDTIHAITQPQHMQVLNQKHVTLILPDEDITKNCIARYASQATTQVVSVFVRWDKTHSTTPHPSQHDHYTPTAHELYFMKEALKEGEKSSDWWRQVGAVATKGETIIAQAHNTHLPNPHTPNIEGDARAQFHKGEHIECTTAIHAEAKLIAQMAKTGTSLEGAHLYVTDFPCPTCAKLIAHAGITTVFYHKGYSVFDGQRVLTTAGVKLIQMDVV